MSHPRNKRERFLIGKHKGEKRAEGLLESRTCRWFVETSRALRNTTSLCSCHMCGNPRHSVYSKGDTRLTMQERKSKAAFDTRGAEELV